MIDSSPQLRIRILTGRHAGAEVSLNQGKHAIGSDPDCDIVISDWPLKVSAFTVTGGSGGNLMIAFDDPSLAAPFGFNEPQQIGDIAIASSHTDPGATRLSDMELLKLMLVPEVPVVVVEPRSAGLARWVAGGIIVAIATLSAFTFEGTHSVAATKARAPVGSPLEQVREVVTRARYPGIQVSVEGNMIVVAGLLKNAQERDALAARLGALQVKDIEHRYAAESDIAAAISDALALPGVKVKHVGGGRFEVSGDIPAAVREEVNLSRLKNDLGPVVTSITFSLPDEPIVDPKLENLQNTQGFQIRIATDGVRYFMPE